VQKPMATILLIDDEESVRRFFQAVLERAGYQVLTAENGKRGLRLLEHEAVDLIVVDILMPEMDGMELIPLLRKTRPAIKMIAISGGSGLMNYLDAAKDLGAHDTLEKPFSPQELLDAVSVQVVDLQSTWKQYGSPICEHLKVELERNEIGCLTGNYHCTTCGRSVPR